MKTNNGITNKLNNNRALKQTQI